MPHDEAPPPPPPLDGTLRSFRGRSASLNPTATSTSDSTSHTSLSCKLPSPRASVAIHKLRSTSTADDDPLSPRTRLEMESQRQQLHTNGPQAAVDGDRLQEDASSRRYSLQSPLVDAARPLSPHQAMVRRVDSLLGAKPRHCDVAGANVAAAVRAGDAVPSCNLPPPPPVVYRRDELKLPSSCGAAILYNAPIRLRLSARQCLRIAAAATDATLLHPTVSARAHEMRNPIVPPVRIDVSGEGLAGDDDQVFVLQNTSLRADCGAVHYAHVVALYCVSGSCRGQFLSVDAAAQTLTTKKGPVISNREKWRLVNPSTERGGGGHDAVDVAAAASLLYEQQRAVVTSDRVLLKMHTADLYLSVPTAKYDRADASAMASVVLSKENDGIHETVQVWTLTKANLPFDPDWNRQRPYLTGDALVLPQTKRHHAADACEARGPPLATLPPSAQESMLVDDLLYVFLGVEGRYIKLASTETCSVDATQCKQSVRFGLSEMGMDPSLLTLATRCLPLGEFYLQVMLYIEQFSRYEYGQVNHALCAALKTLIKEYRILVGQLEYQTRNRDADTSFSLQKLWYNVQPSLRTLEMLSVLVTACRQTIGGGSLLTEIQRIMSSLAGDSNARKVFSFLMERASVPYLKMVERWIYYGDLVDPYDEFMIRRDNQVSKEDVQDNPYSTYWQSRYTVRASQVPLFLARVAPKILTAGKYLHVFRTCNRQADCPFANEIAFSLSDSVYEELIDKAHAFASRMLLDLFVRENDLQNRLISLKHYFLMDQGDFFVDFMNIAEEELKLRADKLSLPRLESLLHLSLQTSTCSSDPYKDDLQCFLSPHNLISHMETIHQRAQKGPGDSLTTFESSTIGQPGYKVIDAFTLDYKVRWPLSLVVSCGALTKYQMIFRHIFFCKHVERQLCDAWLNHQATKELSLRSALGPSYCLRQRMLHFQQNLVYYMMFEVVSPRWHDFQQQLTTAGTVDDILEFQGDFLDICLKECLLTDPELLRVLTRLTTVCMTFANSIETFTRQYSLDEETIKAERDAERDRRAEKKAREEAEVALASYQRQKGTFGGKKKGSVLRRRQSSQVEMRRTRIKELSDDVKRALTERTDGGENLFARMTNDLASLFDSLLGEFMQQLLRRSLLQVLLFRISSPCRVC